jgi:hypothetical protein
MYPSMLRSLSKMGANKNAYKFEYAVILDKYYELYSKNAVCESDSD